MADTYTTHLRTTYDGSGVNEMLANLKLAKTQWEKSLDPTQRARYIKFYQEEIDHIKKTGEVSDRIRPKLNTMFRQPAEEAKNLGRQGAEAADKIARGSKTAGDSLGNLALRYISVGYAIRSIVRAFQGFSESDKQMRLLTAQMGKTNEETMGLERQFKNLANEVGLSTQEVIQGFNVWRSRSGLAFDAAKRMYEYVVKMAPIAEASPRAMAEGFGAVVRNLKLTEAEIPQFAEMLAKAMKDSGLEIDGMMRSLPRLTEALANIGYSGTRGAATMVAALSAIQPAFKNTERAASELTQMIEGLGQKDFFSKIGHDADVLRYELEQSGDWLTEYMRHVDTFLQSGGKINKESFGGFHDVVKRLHDVWKTMPESVRQSTEAAGFFKLMLDTYTKDAPHVTIKKLSNEWDAFKNALMGTSAVAPPIIETLKDITELVNALNDVVSTTKLDWASFFNLGLLTTVMDVVKGMRVMLPMLFGGKLTDEQIKELEEFQNRLKQRDRMTKPKSPEGKAAPENLRDTPRTSPEVTRSEQPPPKLRARTPQEEAERTERMIDDFARRQGGRQPTPQVPLPQPRPLFMTPEQRRAWGMDSVPDTLKERYEGATDFGGAKRLSFGKIPPEFGRESTAGKALQGMEGFAEGGVLGVLKRLGYKLPPWLETAYQLVNNPDLNLAAGISNPMMTQGALPPKALLKEMPADAAGALLDLQKKFGIQSPDEGDAATEFSGVRRAAEQSLQEERAIYTKLNDIYEVLHRAFPAAALGGSKTVGEGRATPDYGRAGDYGIGPEAGGTSAVTPGVPREPGRAGTYGITPEAGGAGPAKTQKPTGRTAERIAVAKAAAMDQLRKEGVPEANLEEAANLLAGQALAESGINPREVHDKGTGYGIYGARLDRRDKMLKWMRENGYPQDSIEGQMRYMAHEAMTNKAYKRTRQALMGAEPGTREQRTATITREFENPKDKGPRQMRRRTEMVGQAARVGATPTPTAVGRVGPTGARDPRSAATYGLGAEQGVVTPKFAGRGGAAGGAGATAGWQGDGGAPPAVIAKAREIALSGDPNAVQAFMASQGYPKSGNWCGQFAASVVRSVGGTPPKNPGIASNWRNYGKQVETPQAGDIAVRKIHRKTGRPVQTGHTGSHVTVVEGYDPETGKFTGLGGNQGKWRQSYKSGQFEFFRGGAGEKTQAAQAEQGAGTTQQTIPMPQPRVESGMKVLKPWGPTEKEPETWSDIGKGRRVSGADEVQGYKDQFSQPIPIKFQHDPGEQRWFRHTMRREADREVREARWASFSDIGSA